MNELNLIRVAWFCYGAAVVTIIDLVWRLLTLPDPI